VANWAHILIEIGAHHFQSLCQVSAFWLIPAHGNLGSSGRLQKIIINIAASGNPRVLTCSGPKPATPTPPWHHSVPWKRHASLQSKMSKMDTDRQRQTQKCRQHYPASAASHVIACVYEALTAKFQDSNFTVLLLTGDWLNAGIDPANHLSATTQSHLNALKKAESEENVSLKLRIQIWLCCDWQAIGWMLEMIQPITSWEQHTSMPQKEAESEWNIPLKLLLFN